MTTHATLKSDIASYLDRSDLTNTIPTFIRLAESRLRNDVRVPAMQTETSLTVATTGSATLPTDFIEPIRLYLNVDNQRGLIYQTPEVFHSSLARQTAGNPGYFTIEASTLKFAPIPADSPTVSLLYWAAFDALSAADDTNWLLTNHYDIYLYACLAEAKAFLEDDARIMKWLSAYQDAVAKVNKISIRSRWSGPLTSTVVDAV